MERGVEASFARCYVIYMIHLVLFFTVCSECRPEWADRLDSSTFLNYNVNNPERLRSVKWDNVIKYFRKSRSEHFRSTRRVFTLHRMNTLYSSRPASAQTSLLPEFFLAGALNAVIALFSLVMHTEADAGECWLSTVVHCILIECRVTQRPSGSRVLLQLVFECWIAWPLERCDLRRSTWWLRGGLIIA